MKPPHTLVIFAATCLLVGQILAEQNSSNKQVKKRNSRLSRQTSADQMVQNILKWLQGVYTQQNRRSRSYTDEIGTAYAPYTIARSDNAFRQGSLREYLPPTVTEKPRPFEPRPDGDGTDDSGNFVDTGYPPSGGVTPEPPFSYPTIPSVRPSTPTPGGYPTGPVGPSTLFTPSPPAGFQTQPPETFTSSTPEGPYPYPPSGSTERPGYPSQPPVETESPSIPGSSTSPPFVPSQEPTGYPTSRPEGPEVSPEYPGFPSQPPPGPSTLFTPSPPAGFQTQPPTELTSSSSEGLYPYPPSGTTERSGYSTQPPVQTESPSIPGSSTSAPFVPSQEPTGNPTSRPEGPEVSPEYPGFPSQPPPGPSTLFTPSPPAGFQTQPSSTFTSSTPEGPYPYPPSGSTERPGYPTQPPVESERPSISGFSTSPPFVPSQEPTGYPTSRPEGPEVSPGYPGFPSQPPPGPSTLFTLSPLTGFETQSPASSTSYPTEGQSPYPPSVETTERPDYPSSPPVETESPSVPGPPYIPPQESTEYPTPGLEGPEVTPGLSSEPPPGPSTLFTPLPPAGFQTQPPAISTEEPSPDIPSVVTTERPGYTTQPPIEIETPSVPGFITLSPYSPQEPTGFSTSRPEGPDATPESPGIPSPPPSDVSPTQPPQEVVTPGFPGFPTAPPPGVTPGFPTAPPVTPGFPTDLPPAVTPGFPTAPPPGVTPGYPTAPPPGVTPGFPTAPPPGVTPGFPTESPPGVTPGFPTAPPPGVSPGFPTAQPPEVTSGYPTASPTSPGFPTSSPEFTSPPAENEPKGTITDEDLRHPPHIHAIDVECGKEMMTINLEFNRVFDGVIYSKGYYNMPECRYVNENSGQTKYTFTVNLNMCGTEFINAFDTLGQSYLENVLVIQNEAGIQEIWDTIRSVRCLWEGNLKEQLSVSLMVGMLTQEIVTFSGDTAMAKLDIQLGRDPFGQPATGLVKIGEPMTLVVSVSGDPGFDIQVKDCRATDSTGVNIVPLTDDNGCVLKPKLFGAFQKTRNTGNTGASIIAYAYFNAFKFPDVMDIMIECNIELCKTDCEMCPNPDQALEPAKRRKRDLYSSNSTLYSFNTTLHDGVVMGKHLRVVLPEDLAATTVVNDAVCLSTQSFVFSSSVLISLLTASCLFSAYLWLKSNRQKVVTF